MRLRVYQNPGHPTMRGRHPNERWRMIHPLLVAISMGVHTARSRAMARVALGAGAFLVRPRHQRGEGATLLIERE